jgi:hypothetical protein
MENTLAFNLSKTGFSKLIKNFDGRLVLCYPIKIRIIVLKMILGIKIILGASVIFTSCKFENKGENFKDYFANVEVIELTGNRIHLQENGKPLSYMFNMTFFDSLILVNEFPDRDYTYKLIDLRDQSVRSFGKKGEGPNELLSDAFYFSVDRPNNRLFLTDNVHYYIYDVFDLKNGSDEPKEKFTIDQRDKRFMGSTVHVNGYIVGSMLHKRFCAYQISNQKLIEGEAYKGGPSMALANQSFYMNHPTKNMAVYGMSKVPEFGILTIKKDTIEVNKFSWGETSLEVSHTKETMAVVGNEELRYEYTSVAVTEEFIYFLYSGKKIDRSSRKSMMNSGLSNEVYVLDWEGKPIRKYKLDQPTRSIAVDSKDKILYTASFEENPMLVAYNLTDPK